MLFETVSGAFERLKPFWGQFSPFGVFGCLEVQWECRSTRCVQAGLADTLLMGRQIGLGIRDADVVPCATRYG